MIKDTIDNDMARQSTAALQPGEIVSKLKLFVEDHDMALKIQKLAQPMFQITLQEILRDAIHSGLPAVMNRYKAAVEAARNADKH